MANRGMNKQMRSIFVVAGKNDVGPLKVNTFYTAVDTTGKTVEVRRTRVKGASKWSWEVASGKDVLFVGPDLPFVAEKLGYTLTIKTEPEAVAATVATTEAASTEEKDEFNPASLVASGTTGTDKISAS